MVEIAVRARAKVNLALHVVGRRTDGYHLLDSLVVFADLGDEITLRPDPGLALTIGGPMAAGLDAGPENLVLRAAALMGGGAAIHLDKRLPVASGIGGGSADAAGIQAGDILTKIGDTPLGESTSFVNALFRYSPGETIPIEIVRDQEKQTVQVRLQEMRVR